MAESEQSCDAHLNASQLKNESSDLNRFYELGALLGAGSLGDVYEAKKIPEESFKYAIKKIRISEIAEWKKYSNVGPVPSEIECMARCKNLQGVVDLIEYFETSKYVFIVMDTMPCAMNLVQYLRKYGRLDEKQGQHIFSQVAAGTMEIHKRGILHGDLVPKNIIIQPESQKIKIIDFGCSTDIKSPFMDNAGLSMPESLEEKTHTYQRKSVGQLGNLLYCMFGLGVQSPFIFGGQITMLKLKNDVPLSVEGIDILTKCLQVKLRDRPTLQDVIQHKWLNPASDNRQE